MHVGIYGGNKFIELGTSSRVRQFFHYIDMLDIDSSRGDIGIITDSLFRRYITIENHHKLLLSLRIAESGLSIRTIGHFDDDHIIKYYEINQTEKHRESNTKSEFPGFFGAIRSVIESSRHFYKMWKMDNPIRIIRSELKYYNIDISRSLSEYDLLQGEPFWLRD